MQLLLAKISLEPLLVLILKKRQAKNGDFYHFDER
jgi:hypothetical protein